MAAAKYRVTLIFDSRAMPAGAYMLAAIVGPAPTITSTAGTYEVGDKLSESEARALGRVATLTTRPGRHLVPAR